MDGSTALGSVLLSGSTTSATASFTTNTLAAGTHAITAVYTGVNGYVSSTSAAVSQVVTAPALNTSFSPASITMASGSNASDTLLLTPVGGYSGTVSLTCQGPGSNLACQFVISSFTLTGSNTQLQAPLLIGADGAASLAIPSRPGSKDTPQIFAAFLLLPVAGFAGLAAFRRRRSAARGLGLLMLLLSGIAALGITGCSNGTPGNFTPPGTYTLKIGITANNVTTTQNLTVVVQ
jgi:hypothetical protein